MFRVHRARPRFARRGRRPRAGGAPGSEATSRPSVPRALRLGVLCAIRSAIFAYSGSPGGEAYVTGLDGTLAQVTGHQLLSHTSGMLDEAPMYGSHDEAALAKEVRGWTADRLFTEPGRVYSYSNPAYWLAGFLIETVSGKLYADQMHESLFAPLGMASTTLRPTVAMTYPLAQGHDAPASGRPTVVRPAANNAASWPAGSIFSNVLDLSRFVIAFLNGGRLEGRQTLPPGVIARLTTPAVKVPGTENSYGYGLNIGTYRGVRVFQAGARWRSSEKMESSSSSRRRVKRSSGRSAITGSRQVSCFSPPKTGESSTSTRAADRGGEPSKLRTQNIELKRVSRCRADKEFCVLPSAFRILSSEVVPDQRVLSLPKLADLPHGVVVRCGRTMFAVTRVTSPRPLVTTTRRHDVLARCNGKW